MVRSSKRLTLAWSAKESIFKWYGLGEMDFRNHMFLNRISAEGETGIIEAIFANDSIDLRLSYQVFEPLILSWLATEK